MASFISRTRGLGFGLLLVALNSACGQTPLSTLYALQKVDAETTPAAAMRVMVDLPDFVHPQQGGITLDLRETGAPEGLKFHLIPVPDEQKIERAKRGGNLFIYKIKPADIALFDNARSSDDTEDDTGMQLTANSDVCLATSQIPDHAYVTIYLKTAELPDYVVLVNKIDMVKKMSTGQLAIEIPMCG